MRRPLRHVPCLRFKFGGMKPCKEPHNARFVMACFTSSGITPSNGGNKFQRAFEAISQHVHLAWSWRALHSRHNLAHNLVLENLFYNYWHSGGMSHTAHMPGAGAPVMHLARTPRHAKRHEAACPCPNCLRQLCRRPTGELRGHHC